ncbi:acyl transferase [Rhodococcus sp. 14C212]|uniref:acyl transferase n=1 Tax=Rhodococcus sp. 14C212 TaxID=2711209 RepID=UPI001F0DE089|nr:acyl transferase [Rhodococcus sp. 14C212]
MRRRRHHAGRTTGYGRVSAHGGTGPDDDGREPSHVPSPETPPAPTSEDTTPPPGSSFPGENLTPGEAEALQRAVDEGRQPWRLDPSLVAQAFVAARFGWSDTDARAADPHTVEVTNRADGSIVVLQLRRPAREGADGIWVVTDGVRIG